VSVFNDVVLEAVTCAAVELVVVVLL